ncbi:unnamed protein product [Linum trigynum]|uniref:Reverse transcriptase domain-containing protein n=1 Tax=Linum trigynum TaxID=586398 RepID=A0AAV2DY24_9ROSI
MNDHLTMQVSRAEIRNAVFSIGKEQSLGSDGFTAAFYQRFWEEIGWDVSEAILSFFQTGRLLHSVNHTLLTLIPKVANADSMRQMRPIGLCQVLYKIIAKILASRLSSVLPQIISPFQNGFVKGRCISDNILIGQEVMQFLKTKVRGQDKWMALKLDMEKAYDRVEWEFLFQVMKSIGFCEKWMVWIKACISTVHFLVLLNGTQYGYFQPQRGIRQGDPLSPLLFAIYTEAFSAKLSQEIASSSLHELRLHRYLGLPSQIRRSKSLSFQFIEEDLAARIRN